MHAITANKEKSQSRRHKNFIHYSRVLSLHNENAAHYSSITKLTAFFLRQIVSSVSNFRHKQMKTLKKGRRPCCCGWLRRRGRRQSLARIRHAGCCRRFHRPVPCHCPWPWLRPPPFQAESLPAATSTRIAWTPVGTCSPRTLDSCPHSIKKKKKPN